jgi:hypothetical protein
VAWAILPGMDARTLSGQAFPCHHPTVHNFIQ